MCRKAAQSNEEKLMSDLDPISPTADVERRLADRQPRRADSPSASGRWRGAISRPLWQ